MQGSAFSVVVYDNRLGMGSEIQGVYFRSERIPVVLNKMFPIVTRKDLGCTRHNISLMNGVGGSTYPAVKPA